MTEINQKTRLSVRTIGLTLSLIGGLSTVVALGFLFFGNGPLTYHAGTSGSVATCAPLDLPEFGRLTTPERIGQVRHELGTQTAALHGSLQQYRYGRALVTPQMLATIAERRKAALLELLAFDPGAAADNLLDSADRQALANITIGCVEQPMTVTGTLDAVHADFFSQGQSDTRYFIQEPNGKQHALVLVDASTPSFRPGTTLTVDGSSFDGLALLAGGNQVQQSSGTSTTTTQSATTISSSQPLAVLPAIYQIGDAVPGVTLDTLQSVYFGTSQSLADYWSVTSYEKMSVPGSIVNNGGSGNGRWVSLNLSTKTCTYSTLASAAAAAADPYVDFSVTRHLSVISNFRDANGVLCPWGGVSWVGGYNFTTQEGAQRIGVDLIRADQVFFHTVAHEFGHDLELNHAAFYNCGTTSLGPTGCTTPQQNNVSSGDYGDLFDTMGLNTGHLNAPHMDALGLFNTGNLQEVTSSGTYVLYPMEDNNTSLKGIKVQRGLGPDYMYVEYRQPRLYDDNSYNRNSTNAFQGALVHVTPTGSSTYPYLIDSSVDGSNPGSQTTPALVPVGATLTDPKTGTTVHLDAVSAPGDPGASLTVTVTLAPDTQPPTVSMSSPANGSTIEVGVAGSLGLNATATDNVTVTRKDFYAQYLDAPSDPIFVGSTQALFQFVSWRAGTLPNGRYQLTARAFDLAGNHSDGSVIVNLLNAPPAVTITSPQAGQTVSGSITVSATATDTPCCVMEVDYYLDGSTAPFAPPQSGNSTSVTLDTTTLTNGNHQLQVKATDQVGYVGVSAPVTVSVNNSTTRGGTGGCFTADTLVNTPFGLKPIVLVRAGDTIYAYDAATDRTVLGKVNQLLIHPNEPYGVVSFSDGSSLNVTAVHRFYNPSTKEWKAIGEMRVGDAVQRGLGPKAHPVTIKSMEFTSGQGVVYNLEVDQYHTYYVNGVLVHNAKKVQKTPVQ